MALQCVYRIRTGDDGLTNVFWRVASRWMHCHGPTSEQAARMWVDDQIAMVL